jgi:very-short-patch-repair endonuclease
MNKINKCKKKYASNIPCWAITSLSAKGRIDFDSGIFDVVIFDEASQCDIASALPLLYRAKSAVIIGDPKQLTHISKLPRKQDIRLLGKHDLSDKFISWAYSFNSLYDLMSGYIDNSLINLLDHHRSHKDIINFSNKQFYEDKLRIATNYDSLVLPEKNEAGVRWVDVSGQSRRYNQGSPINEIEAKAVIKEIERLILENNYIGKVGVVTPFRHQANLIRDMAYANKPLSEKLIKSDFLVDTAHKFQGDERDIMIFSPVYSEGFPDSSVRFLQSQGNIFNVAITRARAQLIVVGDLKMCSNSEIDYLKNFAIYTRSLSSEKIETLETISSDHGANYPTVQNPESVSDWEILFYKELYKRGIKTIPQYPLEKYRLDLAIIDGNRKLDIEVDGVRYHQNWDGELCRRDMIRNSRIQELGWDVKRFWVYQIRDDLENCITEIEKWITNK